MTEVGPGPDSPLHRMFAGVPRRYDRLNRLLTGGWDQRWRRRAAEACLAAAPSRLLDLCTGTGDLAVLLARRLPPGAELVAADFCEPMLAEARRKAEALGVGHRIDFRVADAAALPFPDRSFDAVAIAFGFRNLVWRNPARDRHLAELRRVIAPDGRLVIVETSRPRHRLWRGLVDAWYALVVGPLGGRLAGRPAAYRYLSASARAFHDAGEVSALLRDAGFARVEATLLLGGVAALHRAGPAEP